MNEKQETKEGNDTINKSYNGLLVVKARNGNFNAGFDGNPRTLPDGTIFATDKALKYCIREYLATFKNMPIFVRRNRYLKEENNKENIKNIKYSYETLEENFYSKLKQLQDKGLFKEFKKEDITKKEDKVLDILKSFLDIRLFGVVISAIKTKNISLTGPVQISYGINKLQSSNAYLVRILSPYRRSKNDKQNSKEQDKNEENSQTTIGSEVRADEVYYVYNISVNHVNAQNIGMTKEDLAKLKEALLNSVDLITSTTKYGCESIALIWLSNKENLILNNLDEFVKISKDNEGRVTLDINKLKGNLEQYGFDGIEKEEYSLTKTNFERELENKIHIIYKKDKLEIKEDKPEIKEDKPEIGE